MNRINLPLHLLLGILGAALSAASLEVAAQAVCSDLVIEHVRYAAFDGTAVEVLVTNNGGVGFSAPEFNLVHTNFDTLAREPFDFFAMPAGTQTHTMQQLSGMPLPLSPFTGELVLRYNALGGSGTCTFPLNAIELCPPDPCTELYLGVHQIDTAVIATLDWSVTDGEGNSVASGEIALDTISPWQRIDTLCLPPGNYELHVQPTVVSPYGQFYCKLFRDPLVYPDPHVVIGGDEGGHLPFTYYGPCAEGASAIEKPAPIAIQWSVLGSMLHLTNTNGNALGIVDLFDARGSRIAHSEVSASFANFDLAGQAPGLYIISTQDIGTRTTQRFILN